MAHEDEKVRAFERNSVKDLKTSRRKDPAYGQEIDQPHEDDQSGRECLQHQRRLEVKRLGGQHQFETVW